MRTLWAFGLLLVCGLAAINSAVAEEPHLQFVQGLRAKGYIDYTLLYLDMLNERQDIPNDIKVLIPYERAITLLASSKRVTNQDAKGKLLGQSLDFLKEFTDKNARHPLAGEANSQRAQILLGMARVEIWQSRSPANKDGRAEFQKRARGLIGEARTVFKTAHDQHKTAWESHGKSFIDKTKEPERYEARRKAEVKYMRAQYDLARCTFEDAQTYDIKSGDFTKNLITASKEFEDIHSKYRTQVVGLFSRMWQGKCFEEQDDIQKALGIYNELLGHGDRSPVLRLLKDQVTQFRLVCLNHETRKDYDLVIGEGLSWVTQAARAKTRSEVGLGIRWEVLRAQESKAKAREPALPEPEEQRLLRQALEHARFINRYPGQYKDLSQFKIRELLVALDRDIQDPEDFDTAFGLADSMLKQLKPLKDADRAAKTKEEKQKTQADLDLHLNEMARYLQIALALADEDVQLKDVNRARYLLSYVYYLTRQSYKSAILGEYVAKHYNTGEDASLAQDAAYLALGAYILAYNDSPDDQKPVDLKMMEGMGRLIVEKWPESDRANDARMQLGRVFNRQKKPAEAAVWYGSIPESSSMYAEAQADAGQAYWTAFINAAIADESEKPPKETLKGWQDSAERHLRAGIQKIQSGLPEMGETPPELTAAKFSLSQILLSKGDYTGAITQLTGEPHSVVKAISIADESKRPKPPNPKSADFAQSSYQLLLRAYIGDRKLEPARSAMDELEKIAKAAGGGNTEAVTEIYRQLGQQLQEELEQLKGLGDKARTDEVRQSFEAFLGDLSKREQQTYNSLIWIAETYFGLGQGSSDDKTKADGYYNSAGENYQKILDIVEADPELVEAKRLVGVKVRLVNCRRRKGDFEGAETLVTEVLAKSPKALDVQIEAAYVYQDWGESGQIDTIDKLEMARKGGEFGEAKATVWGWSQIAKRLQGIIQMQGESAKEKYLERYLESRYNLYLCRRLFGNGQAKTADKTAELKKAEAGLMGFALVTSDINDEWWKKFDRLYQDIQEDMGVLSPKELERPEVVEPMSVAAADPEEQESSNASTTPDKAVKPTAQVAADSSGKGLGFIIGAVVCIAAFGGIMFVMLKGNKPRRVAAYAPATAPVLPVEPAAAAPAVGQRRKRPSSSSSSGQKRQRPASSSGKPRQRPKGEAGAKPRPKRKKPPEGES